MVGILGNWENKGLEERFKQGYEQGYIEARIKERRRIVLSMIREKMEVPEISRSTELPEAQIFAIKKAYERIA